MGTPARTGRFAAVTALLLLLSAAGSPAAEDAAPPSEAPLRLTLELDSLLVASRRTEAVDLLAAAFRDIRLAAPFKEQLPDHAPRAGDPRRLLVFLKRAGGEDLAFAAALAEVALGLEPERAFAGPARRPLDARRLRALYERFRGRDGARTADGILRMLGTTGLPPALRAFVASRDLPEGEAGEPLPELREAQAAHPPDPAAEPETCFSVPPAGQEEAEGTKDPPALVRPLAEAMLDEASRGATAESLLLADRVLSASDRLDAARAADPVRDGEGASLEALVGCAYLLKGDPEGARRMALALLDGPRGPDYAARMRDRAGEDLGQICRTLKYIELYGIAGAPSPRPRRRAIGPPDLRDYVSASRLFFTPDAERGRRAMVALLREDDGLARALAGIRAFRKGSK